MAEKADKENFLAVFPQGIAEDPSRQVNVTEERGKNRNFRTWSDGSEVTDSSKKGTDDVAFIGAILDDLDRKYDIDAGRIYATGFSNGATMSFMLGVKLSDRIAAIAPIAGLLYAREPPENPVSLISILGSEDRPPEEKKMMLVKKSYAASYLNNPVSVWSGYLNCADEQREEDENVLVINFGLCIPGTHVTSYIVKGMGHVFPGKANFFAGDPEVGNKVNAVDISWEFFGKHAKMIN